MPNFKRVIILLADGARPDVMSELISSGELPAIKGRLSDAGTMMTAVTAFPSTTGPAYMPFLTGCLPATCNVPGIRWVDKVQFAKPSLHFSRHRSYVGLETYLIGHDMRRDLPTLQELMQRSYNIFSSVNKGVSFAGNLTRVSRIWHWYYAHLTDRWSFVDKCGVNKFRKLLKKPFDLIFMVMPGIDEYSHIANYKNSSAIDAYRRIDKAVNTACEELSEKGMWDDTLFWLVSDHGLSVTHTHFCMNTFLEDRGIRTFYYPKIFKKGCVAANMMSGNGMTHLYFMHRDGWQYPMYRSDLEEKYPNFLPDLLNEKAVDIVALRSDYHTVDIISRRGEATAELKGDFVEYKVKGSDPFGFENMEGCITSDELLKKTMNSKYPDAIYQLAHLFISHRTGDVVISAAKGFDLRDMYEVPEHKGSHGSLHREHMLVPMICNAKLMQRHARTVDVFPTTLKLLGHPIPGNVDGKSLV